MKIVFGLFLGFVVYQLLGCSAWLFACWMAKYDPRLEK